MPTDFLFNFFNQKEDPTHCNTQQTATISIQQRKRDILFDSIFEENSDACVQDVEVLTENASKYAFFFIPYCVNVSLSNTLI